MGCRDQTWGKQNDLGWKKTYDSGATCNWCYISRNITRKRGWIWCVISTHLPAKVSCVAGSIHLSRQTPRGCEQPGVNTTMQVSSFSPLDSFHQAHRGMKKVVFHVLDPTWMAEDPRMKRFYPREHVLEPSVIVYNYIYIKASGQTSFRVTHVPLTQICLGSSHGLTWIYKYFWQQMIRPTQFLATFKFN